MVLVHFSPMFFFSLMCHGCFIGGINLLSQQNQGDLRPNKFVYPSNAPLIIDRPAYFKGTLTFHTGLGRTL